ncbi:MAG TPA: dTDP-4-dehydrorhamnose reductase [Stellaceae bacterium]|nr:dTDP-4-dehydrorhamnose reductase [Stellaceae bacterium]
MTAPHILVTGAAGQVGSELRRAPWPAGFRVTGFTRSELDVTRKGALRAAVEPLAPSLIVNAAAYTAVDKAESEPQRALAGNRDAVANLAELCRDLGIPLLHLSTDYVFDGTKDGAYREDDAIAPLSVYGRSKAEGEEVLRRVLARHIILRTSWVFGLTGSNFVKTMLRLGAERDTLAIVADQRGCPTAAADIARTIALLAARVLRDEGPWGTYHYAGTPAVTWHGFAEAIFDVSAAPGGKRPILRAIPTSDYPTAARRPLNSVLDCAKIGAHFGVRPAPWKAALATVVERGS